MSKFGWKEILMGLACIPLVLMVVLSHPTNVELAIFFLVFGAGLYGEENQRRLERIEQKLDSLASRERNEIYADRREAASDS